MPETNTKTFAVIYVKLGDSSDDDGVDRNLAKLKSELYDSLEEWEWRVEDVVYKKG